MINIILQIAIPAKTIEEYKKCSLKELEVDPNISGYFKLEINSFVYGFTQDKPIEEDEQGWDIPAIWLEHLLVVSNEISSRKYIAIANTETSDNYLEFQLEENDQIRVSEISIECQDWVLFKKMQNAKIKNSAKSTISINELSREVYKAKANFIKDLSKINPLFLEVKEVKRLISM